MNQREQFYAFLEQVRKDNHPPPTGFEIWQAAQAAAVPEGWQVVPKEATSEMSEAGDHMQIDCGQTASAVYRAMLAVAPKPEDV